ncbi:MAG: glycoside hydrolase family 3 N-terminal domain-containing protein [Eubacteriales bacterium]|nr:glycoside hydrolase family 3 N-terminal domain-containing protein [Eubacteriales bacterium]
MRARRKLLGGMVCMAMLALAPLGATAQADDAALSIVDAVLTQMTLEEKVAQLFFVRPEVFSRIASVSEPSAKLERAFARFGVGGVILFPENMKNAAQLARLTEAMRRYAIKQRGIDLFLGVDEEGGGVARVAAKLKLKEPVPSMSVIGETGDTRQAYEAGRRIGGYLSEYGFTLDFAPVADVRTDIKGAEITKRSFGYDAQLVAGMVKAFTQGLQEQGVLAVLKHFPGHGAASGNSHNGAAISTRTLEEWRACEWLPFREGMQAGADMVMVSHQIAATVDNDVPASLSFRIITELLRGELRFQGVVITDALRMKAVSETYGSGEACVRAIEAGCDMLLLPKNFSNGYNGVMAALEEGRLTETRIDESVRRILMLKAEWGLLKESAQRQ